MARYVVGFLVFAFALPVATPARRAPCSASPELLGAVDRAGILSSFRIVGLDDCNGDRQPETPRIQNLWPYAYGESVTLRGDEWTTVSDGPVNWAAIYHRPAPCRNGTTAWRPGPYQTSQELRGTSIYTFAPKPSALGLGGDHDLANWAFPIGAHEVGRPPAARDPVVRGLAFCSGYHDGAAWTNPAVASLYDSAVLPARPRGDAFAECRRTGDPERCFGYWGPRDGSYPRSGWMPDGTLASTFLRILYGAMLAEEVVPGRRANGYGLIPAVGPRTGHGIQHIYPFARMHDGILPIGHGRIVFDAARRRDVLNPRPYGPATGALLYGWFERRCTTVFLLGATHVDRD